MSLITFKGISQNSSISKPITDEEFSSIAEEYYKKPSFDKVVKQFTTISKGGTMMNHIYDYYLKEVMSKAIGTRASWSIYDGIHNREIMEYFAGKVANNKKVFPDTMSLAKKIETAFRLCGIRYCVKLPNYPLKSVYYILDRFNINNNWYDFSCGWGARLLGALYKNINYFGTDPNTELVDRLNDIQHDYKKEITSSSNIIDIHKCGAQTLNKEWVNKMGLAFSSPPYYDLEDYQIGEEQSYKKGMSYSEWVSSFIVPMIANINQYLINGGHFVINVKSYRDYKTNEIYDIEKDVYDTATNYGLKLIEISSLDNIKRCHGNVAWKDKDNKIFFSDNSEKIFVFEK